MSQQVQNNQYIKSTFGTKVAYGLGDVGFAFSWAFVSNFITMFYTDGVGLSGAFIGTMMLICRLLDGASDFIVGGLIEKTNTKLGKCKPWLIGSILPLAISMVAMFTIPQEWSESGKGIYAYVTYIFMAVICYTISNLAYNSLMSRFTTDPDDVTVTSAVRMFMAVIASMMVNMLTLDLVNAFGGIKSMAAWRKLVLLYAAIGLVMQCVMLLRVKETVADEQMTDKGTVKNRLPVLEIFKKVLTCKYFWLTMGEFALVNGGFVAINAYYAKDVLGSESYIAPMSLGQMGVVLVMQPILPKIVKWFGKRKVMLVGALFFVVSGVMVQLAPYSAAVVIPAYFIRGFGQSIYMGLVFTLSADLVDYIKRRDGINAEGVCYASCSIGTKIGAGLGMGLVGWTLEWGHYDGKLLVQAQEALDAMINLNGLDYIVIGTLMFVFMYFLRFELPEKQESGHEQ